MLRDSLILISLIAFLFSCEKNITSGTKGLVFSDDTIYFDTVFTTIGSTTRELRVRNAENHRVRIDEVYLGGGEDSQFRINIDGEPVFRKQNFEMDAGDSIFIFIDVFVDPTGNNSPVAVSDSIIFRCQGIVQQVQLLAWGQDILLFNNEIIKSQNWQEVKPYVIYNNIFVDTLETLTIGEGVRVFFHNRASMTVAGKLIIDGSAESPVLFASDRIEEVYDDVPGQWKGIMFLNTSKGNSFNHAIIRNAVYGIQLGEAKTGTDSPEIYLLNTDISHSSVSCFSAYNSNVEAVNCIFSHAGNYCIFLAAGGDYSFAHCTVSDSWEYGFRLTSAVTIAEQPVIPGGITSMINLGFKNSVMYGDKKSEIDIIPSSGAYSGDYLFDHCLLKVDTINAAFWSDTIFTGSLINKDPRFINARLYDFRPDTLSPLIDNGNPLFIAVFPEDIRGVSRSVDGKPDIGAFERIPGEER
jgi:hypothetical protein